MKTLLISLLLMLTTGQAQDKGNVFISATGKKYHTHKECQYIKGHNNIKTITLAQAKQKGLELCTRCASKDKKGQAK